MRRLSKTLMALGLVGAALQVATAEEPGYFSRKEEGWFFYREKNPLPKREEPLPEVPPPTSTPVAPEKEKPIGPSLFSVEWLSKNLESLRKRAIDDPTPDNTTAYMYAQRVMLDKAFNFAEKSLASVRADPLLDENNRAPMATAQLAAALRNQDKAIAASLKGLSAKAGLFFFFKTSCVPFCGMQYEVVNRFAKRYDMTVFPISMDGSKYKEMEGYTVRKDAGQFRQMGLTYVPATVLVVPEQRKYVVLSQGAVAMDELEARVVAAAADSGLLDKDQRDAVNILAKGILKPGEMSAKAEASVDPNNPAEWVAYLRRAIMKSTTGE